MVAGILLARMYDICVSRGMDRALSDDENQVNSIAIAVSDLVFGLDKRYVGYEAVRSTLKHNGMTAQPDMTAAWGTPAQSSRPH